MSDFLFAENLNRRKPIVVRAKVADIFEGMATSECEWVMVVELKPSLAGATAFTLRIDPFTAILRS